jgi:hypothetical protein
MNYLELAIGLSEKAQAILDCVTDRKRMLHEPCSMS